MCAPARPPVCRYAMTSKRVEHLPCTPVSLANGSGLLLPLPGPRGVSGYTVRTHPHPVAVCAVDYNAGVAAAQRPVSITIYPTHTDVLATC